MLPKLAEEAGEFLGERVTEAVITVPAYFNVCSDSDAVLELNCERQ